MNALAFRLLRRAAILTAQQWQGLPLELDDLVQAAALRALERGFAIEHPGQAVQLVRWAGVDLVRAERGRGARRIFVPLPELGTAPEAAPSLEARAAALRAQGLPFREIGARLGLSTSMAHYWIRKLERIHGPIPGVPHLEMQRAAPKLEAAAALVRRGVRYVELLEAGVKPSTARLARRVGTHGQTQPRSDFASGACARGHPTAQNLRVRPNGKRICLGCARVRYRRAAAQRPGYRRQWLSRGATHCRLGHPLTDARVEKSGQVVCRICRRAWWKRYKARKRAAAASSPGTSRDLGKVEAPADRARSA